MKVAHWLKYDGALEKCWRSGNEMKILFGEGWDKKIVVECGIDWTLVILLWPLLTKGCYHLITSDWN